MAGPNFNLSGAAQGASWLFGGGAGAAIPPNPAITPNPSSYVDPTGTTLPTGAGWLSGGAAPAPSNPSADAAAGSGNLSKALDILGNSSLVKGTGEEGGGGGGGAPAAPGGSATGRGQAGTLDPLVAALQKHYMGLYPGGAAAVQGGPKGLLGV